MRSWRFDRGRRRLQVGTADVEHEPKQVRATLHRLGPAVPLTVVRVAGEVTQGLDTAEAVDPTISRLRHLFWAGGLLRVLDPAAQHPTTRRPPRHRVQFGHLRDAQLPATLHAVLDRVELLLEQRQHLAAAVRDQPRRRVQRLVARVAGVADLLDLAGEHGAQLLACGRRDAARAAIRDDSLGVDPLENFATCIVHGLSHEDVVRGIGRAVGAGKCRRIVALIAVAGGGDSPADAVVPTGRIRRAGVAAGEDDGGGLPQAAGADGEGEVPGV